jgi:hypothetical protein
MLCKSKLPAVLSATAVCAVSLFSFGSAVSLFDRLLVELDVVFASALLAIVIVTSIIWMICRITSHPMLSALMTILVLSKGLAVGICAFFGIFPLIIEPLSLGSGFFIDIDQTGGMVLFQLHIAAGVVICSLLVVSLTSIASKLEAKAEARE